MTGWLIDTLLYTGLLIGFVLMVRRPAGRWFGAQFAYVLWVLPFLRLLLPPVVLPASLAPAAEPAQVMAAPATSEWVELAPAAAAAAPAWNWADFAEVALSVWLGVALAFLAWRTVTYRRMRRELLVAACPVGEVGKIRLVETPAVASPVAFGVLDKVIALPPLFMAQPDRTARDLAIAHELAHHRGHDLLANFAAQALLALHWFNPLAWMGWRAMRRDQEAACDARVLAGRGRDERVRYAALIAGTAAGQRVISFRGALAAPMACPMVCPVLGDKSIIHRLRSLSMSDTTPGRRRLGRALIAAGALALPLTASISYSAASAQDAPLPPAPPSPMTSPTAAAPPAPPAPPTANEHGARHVVVHREVRREGADAPGEAGQRNSFEWRGDPNDPEFEVRMEQFGRDMEKWGEKWGEEWGEQQRAQALAFAEQARRNSPEVVESCDENERRRTTTTDGRARVVICERDIRAQARAGAMSGLRSARESIAHNREISAEVRAEVLNDLDEEIERIERGGD